MKITLGEVKKSRLRNESVDLIVVGLVSRSDSMFYNTPMVLRNESDVKCYFSTDSNEYNEIIKIIETGVTVVLYNSFEYEKKFYSWLTPIKDNLVIPSCYVSDVYSKKIIFKSPAEFNGETYIIKIKYDPEEIPDQGDFYINLPSGRNVVGIDSEFVSSLSFHTGVFPDYADTINDIYDVSLTQGNLGELFDEIASYFIADDTRPRISDYISPYVLKDAENDLVNGVFTVYYNQPVRYIPKTIHPSSLVIEYGYFENIQYLEDCIPKDTVTFQSKLLGDSSGISLESKDGTLTIRFNDQVEVFNISTDWTAGNFIGNIKSRLVDVTVNADFGTVLYFPEFSENFHPSCNLLDAVIDVNGSISNLLQSEFQINMLILSDSLTEFNSYELDFSKLNKELLIISRNTDLSQLTQDYPNTLKFTGLIDGYPCYIPFLNSIYTCKFGDLLDGVPNSDSEFNFDIYNIWNPKIDEYYNYIESFDLSEFASNLGLSLDKISIYQLFYVMALSKFILRYKSDLLFTLPSITISKLNLLINKFISNFEIFRSVEIVNSELEDNKVNIELSTQLNSVLKNKEIMLNFNLEI